MGKFVKGAPRPPNAGRTKGTPNKKTQSLLELCESEGVNVFQAILKLCKHPDESIQFSALKEAAQYIYPKRKSLEHSGSIDPKMAEAAEAIQVMSKDEQIKCLEDEIKKLKE